MLRIIALTVLLSGFAAGIQAAEVIEILPREAWQRQQQGAILVDVREDDERAQGMAEGALGIPMGTLAASASDYLHDPQVPVLLICRSGQRSKRVAAQLLQQGYTQVFSVQGGTLRWQDEALPMVFPPP